MTATNQRKEAVCQKYNTYLRIINTFGNKVILLKQLFEYAMALGFAKNYRDFHGQIQELLDADIVRQEKFVAFGKKTQLHMLVLRKYAIRFLAGKSQSRYVRAVPQSTTNERIVLSIFKNAYILDKLIIPRINKGEEMDYSAVEKLLLHHRSSLLFRKGEALDYINSLDESFLHTVFDMGYLQGDISRLQEERERRNQAFQKGSMSTRSKGTGSERTRDWADGEQAVLKHSVAKLYKQRPSEQTTGKEKRIQEYSLNNMLSSHIYIAQIVVAKADEVRITLLYFDILNKQDVSQMASNVACTYLMFKNYLPRETKLKLKVGIVALDPEAKRHMEREAMKEVKDWRTRDVKGSLLQVALANWQVDYEAQKNVEVIFTDYNITNRYLDGIKYANLRRR